MTAVDVKLVLLVLAGTTALIEAQKPCCYSKKVMGKTFTLIESNSDEVDAYGCDTANSCVYQEDGTYDRYCFKMGGQEVPDCLQELPTCTKYFAQPRFIKVPKDQLGVDTLFYTLADNNTCTPPTLSNWPTDNRYMYHKLIASDGDLMIFDWNSAGAREDSVVKVEAGSWKTFEFTEVTGFPNGGYVILPWKKDLYLVGGHKNSPNLPQGSVFKSTNGYTWEKLPWELKAAQSELKACITTNAESGHANLVSFGGSGPGNTDKIVHIYDIEDPNPATDGYRTLALPSGLTPEDRSNELVCHDGWVHVATPNYDLHSLKLSNSAEFKKVDYSAHSEGGKLIVYQDKVGLVGGVTSGSDDQTKFYYFDTATQDLKEGSEFPWNDEFKTGDLVPVVTK